MTQAKRVKHAFDDVVGTCGAALLGGPVPRALQGEAVQVDPIKPTSKAPGINPLKLECDKPLSILLKFCF